MKITKELYQYLKPEGKVSSYALSIRVDKDEFQWGNPDDQFTVNYNLTTQEMTGAYYDWSEEEQDWVESEEMQESDLLKRLKEKEFVLV